MKVFVASFINTGIMTVLLQMKLGDYLWFLGENMPWPGSYDANNSQFYVVVGNSMVMTMLVSVFNPNAIPVIMMPWEARKRRKAIESAVT